MKNFYLLLCFFFLGSHQIPPKKDMADPATYLDEIKTALKKEWPGNRTINLVFHGHSVPAGYFKTPVVNTLQAYPYQVLKALKAVYPYAVINIINTSIGGENSENGAKRFATDVLIHKPDVLFIDYALNDRGIGLDKAKASWEAMIKQAQEKNIKIILLTPSPDTSVHILETDNVLEKHALQIKGLAKKYGTGLADSYAAFKQVAHSGNNLEAYMSQINHPNEKGHALIAAAILPYFIN
ncbi:SGNH/GDSL hydrolase family protein [Agriterribacter sp.]|uniref:SGNH/GDSL hydrolase family protein n=1 Tax=Agriterribacter sp. TaxID=2821509 RepID=UPI002D18E1B6|nr:SGNH/GDSL hydrolase family protein [Agriterribacter sp.]HRO47727.1 SGNH/GDSL hydrolase family protein [Agriterribacter sp.]HRQ17210.1 SGNH/GDSL hydrolase family protein [Agriterribacter sp.]